MIYPVLFGIMAKRPVHSQERDFRVGYRSEAGIPCSGEDRGCAAGSEYEVDGSHGTASGGLNSEKLYLIGAAALGKGRRNWKSFMNSSLHAGARRIPSFWMPGPLPRLRGARTTVKRVRDSFDNPKTKDDRMVVNTIAGSNYAYNHPITIKNIRRLWEKVVDGVCENEEHRGRLYQDGMAYISSGERIIYVPARQGQLPELMVKWFAYQETDSSDLLIRTFVAHFYFVSLHPFCDGNGRMARIINASQLFYGGYRKTKTLPLSSAINTQLSGYYSSLADSERVLNGVDERWLDLSPFVSYMLDAFERCLMDGPLSANVLTEAEMKLLELMSKAGIHAESTAKKAAGILHLPERSARTVL